ncbi:hypothetical protein ACOMHN_033575 [Nucella lapillus]
MILACEEPAIINVGSKLREAKACVRGFVGGLSLVSSVAKQHVVVVDDPPEAILGLHVGNHRVFVATQSRVYAVTMSQDD